MKFEALYAENNRQRQKIIGGEYEPTGIELEWKDEALQEVIDKLEKEGGGDQRKVKGIPDFWLTVFQNANESILCGTFESIDEPIMKYLQDVTVSLPPENTSFTIAFHFASNPFFTNTELTKEYLMKNTFDPEDPLDFDGPEIFKSKGCKIDWKAGKNTTVKVIKGKINLSKIVNCKCVKKMSSVPGDQAKAESKGKGKGGAEVHNEARKAGKLLQLLHPAKSARG